MKNDHYNHMIIKKHVKPNIGFGSYSETINTLSRSLKQELSVVNIAGGSAPVLNLSY